MTDWYFLLAPIAVLAVLLLFRFVGCTFQASEGNYVGTVEGDTPVALFLLRETTGATVASNEMGTPDGIIDATPPAIDAGDPNWHSTAVAQPGLDFGVTDPPLLRTDTSPANSAIRFRGGSVQVSANVPPLNNLTEFTVEVLVHPEWDLVSGLGQYYCVLESADFVQVGAQPPPQQKNAGFGIYAGPDDPGNPASQYFWQVWLGVGTDGFERLIPMPYVDVPGNPVSNPGPNVTAEPTYLAFTFSQSQGQAFLYIYTSDRDIDYTTYALNPLPYVEASNVLSVGITPQGPLYPPFPGATPLYPFQGLIGDLAIYNRVLDESTLRNHVIYAFYNI